MFEQKLNLFYVHVILRFILSLSTVCCGYFFPSMSRLAFCATVPLMNFKTIFHLFSLFFSRFFSLLLCKWIELLRLVYGPSIDTEEYKVSVSSEIIHRKQKHSEINDCEWIPKMSSFKNGIDFAFSIDNASINVNYVTIEMNEEKTKHEK